MKYLNIHGATEVLSCVTELSLERSMVRHDMFFEFSTALREFEHHLGELVRDPLWRPFIVTLRRYRFEISAAPLPFDYLGDEFSEKAIARLGRALDICAQVNPELVEPGEKLLAMLSKLAKTSDNPILAKLKEICEVSPIEGGAILVKETRLIKVAADTIQKESPLRTLRLTSVGDLQGDQCFRCLFVIGPARWYPDYVFTAPRGRKIHLVKYAWLVDNWKPATAFLTGHKKSNVTGTTERLVKAFSDTGASASHSVSVLDPAEVLPRIDWDALKHRIGKEYEGIYGSGTEEEEYVDSRLFLLEGDTAVALDCDESAKATIVDPDQVERAPMQRIPVLNIEPGMFLLVRTQGGGEYIAEVANTLMGDHAALAREVQKHWKILLRKAVISSSMGYVVSELRRLGGKRPNEANVRNWMSYRTIKPKDSSDFLAVIRLVGLGDQFDHYWSTMGMIDSAHRRAGQRIAKLLLKEVRKSDISQLSSLGRMDFTLPEVAAGTLSVLRVQGFHSETVPVPVHRLGRLIEVGEANG